MSSPDVPAPADTVDTVVLLSVDSLRLDQIHSHRDGIPLTPNIDTLADRSLEFEEGISPGPATADSVPAMLTGAYPSQFPGFTLPPDGTDPLTLAEHLESYGFTTAAFNQNNLISRRYNFDRGFDHYYDISEESREEVGRGTLRLRVRNLIKGTPLMRMARWTQTLLMENFGKSLYVLDEPGDSLTDRALNWLDDADGKRFLWMHYMDTHHPYLSSPEIQQEFGRELPEEEILKLSRMARSDAENLKSDEIGDLKYAYDCSVRFVDEQIGRIIDHLEREGELENAMVVVTADHGEEFLEHGAFGHRDALWDELIRSPLVVWYPPTGDVGVDGQAPIQSLVDTMVHGEGLFEMLDGGAEYVVAETREGRDGVRCCRGNGYKLVVEDDERTTTRIDGDGEHVVEESTVPDEILAEMEAELDESQESYDEGSDIDEEELRDDLAALGYLDE